MNTPSRASTDPTETPSEQRLKQWLSQPKQLLRTLDKIDCEESLVGFIKRSWHVIEPGQPYVHGWHIDAIADHLEAVTDGHINRLLINVPPGMMKSVSTSVMWPAWEWGPKNRPSTRYVAAAHAQKLAIRDNLRTRRLVASDWYQDLWGSRVTLTRDQNVKEKFENAATGIREAVASGSITGARGDRVIIDDPLSVDDARSDTIRDSVIEWFLEAVPTRLNNPDRSAIIVIMQRLHEDDVSGIILSKQLGYDHLMLPMEYEPRRSVVTSIGFKDPRTEEGELLFPGRFPRSVVERDKRVMGPIAASGQFQQDPEIKGGGIIRRNWWQPWIGTSFPPFVFKIASVDTAYTEKQENDPSAFTLWGVYLDDDRVPRVLLMDAWEDRLHLHELVQRIGTYCGPAVQNSPWGKRGYSVDKLLIEAKASGISVSQELRRLYGSSAFGVEMIDPKNQDKVARAHAVSHLFAEGIVQAPFTTIQGTTDEPDKPRAWAEKVIDQCAKFPRASHDDLVDTTTQALRWLRTHGMIDRKPEIDDAERERAMHRPPDRPIYEV